MTNDELARVCQLYNDGLTCKQVAQTLGRHEDTIRRALKKAQINRREYRDYYAAELDSDYFQVIDMEEKAYWFGFIAADACISKSAGDLRAFHFNLKRADRQSIIKFAEVIQYTGPVRDFTRINKKTGKVYEKTGIDFNNKCFCLCLLLKSWEEFKKSDNPRLFDDLPDNLKRHFVRGFFDGDGCISRNKSRFKSHYFSFAGSYSVLNAIEDWIITQIGTPKKYPKKSKKYKVYRMGWNGNFQVMRFGELIYTGATIWLDRKRARFQALANHYDVLPAIEFDRFNNFEYPLSMSEIKALPVERRSRLVEHFKQIIMARDWIPPQYSDSELKSDYDRLLYSQPDNYISGDGFRSSSGGGLEFAGKRLLVHFQPHYWSTRFRNSPTLEEGWADSAIVLKAVTNMFCTRGSRPSLSRYLRELNFAGARRVSHFHPGFAKAILQRFAPDARTYLDPCAGWGARLLAAAVLQLHYTACDPSTPTYNGLCGLAKHLGYKDHLLYNIPFEEFESGAKYDIIFTSPPFFTIEKYKHGKQSYCGRRNFEDWFCGFLMPLAEKCKRLSDIVVLHVSQKIKDHLSYKTAIPVYLARTAGQTISCEWLLVL